jgi:hypothetical protein
LPHTGDTLICTYTNNADASASIYGVVLKYEDHCLEVVWKIPTKKGTYTSLVIKYFLSYHVPDSDPKVRFVE